MERTAADWTAAETLLETDLERIATRASNPGAALAALAHKVAGERERVEGTLEQLRARLASLPAAIEAEQKLAERCEAIAAKSRAAGRDDLAAAAEARGHNHTAKVAALNDELAGGEGTILRGHELLEGLEAKRAVIVERSNEFGVAETMQDMRVVADEGDDTGLDDLGDLDALVGAGGADTRTDVSAAQPKGGGDLDSEFAALLAAMGEDAAPAPKKAAPEPDDDDDYALPDLVTVGEGELPEGADPESDEPIDFSSLDALAASEAGDAPAKGKAAAPAKSKAAPPATAKAAPPAKAGEEAATKPGGSKRVLVVVGGVIVVAGGTVAALFGFGVL